MEQVDAIQTLLLEKAKNATVSELASVMEQVTGAARLSADLEKLRADVRKLTLEESKLRQEIDSAPKRERSERIKEYVALLGPIVTIIALAGTLLVQSLQFSQAERDKRDAAEDVRWADTVKTISQEGKVSPIVIALNPFLNSPKYGELARSMAIRLMTNSNDAVLFTDLFGAAFVPVGWNNLDQVLKLNRALRARGSPLLDKTYDPATGTNDFKRLTKEEKTASDYIEFTALREICAQVSSVLRRPRPTGASFDLSAARFYDCDLSGVDLSGANIESLSMAAVDLKGANLASITRFEGCYFFEVAWWEAKKISPELVAYLEKDASSKYREHVKYGPKADSVTPQQYAAAIERLKSAAPAVTAPPPR